MTVEELIEKLKQFDPKLPMLFVVKYGRFDERLDEYYEDTGFEISSRKWEDKEVCWIRLNP